MADSLFGAMEKAYVTNPTLNGARAGLRARDETVPQALSGWRPTVTVQGTVSRNWLNTNSTGNKDYSANTGDANIVLNQNVFNGFRTQESVAAADARIDAGRQSLLQTEQETLFNVVQAYMNVYYGRQLVILLQQNVKALQGQLKAAQERFAVGEITRTDVAQARSSVAQAQTQLNTARANLAGDVAQYLQLVGTEPGTVNYPKVRGLPKSLQNALATAAEINPRILANALVEVATQHDIGVERSALLPKLDLRAQADISKNLTDTNIPASKSASVSAVLTVPIYDGGLAYSQVRQAKQLASQQRIAVIEVTRAVRQAVAETWNNYLAAGQNIQAAQVQVQAAQLALSGVQQEYQAGTRTTLDVLNAQTTLINARATLLNQQKNRVVYGYQLLASMGKLTARDLGLSVAIYDPEANYNRVRNKWFGTDVKTME